MKKEKIINEIKEILLIDHEIGINDKVEFDSMSVLLLIVFFDENFAMKVTDQQIKKFNDINDILDFIGKEKIEE